MTKHKQHHRRQAKAFVVVGRIMKHRSSLIFCVACGKSYGLDTPELRNIHQEECLHKQADAILKGKPELFHQ